MANKGEKMPNIKPEITEIPQGEWEPGKESEKEIKYEIKAGMSFGEAISKTIALARKEKAKVTSNFNGIEFEVTPESNPYQVYEKFEKSKPREEDLSPRDYAKANKGWFEHEKGSEEKVIKYEMGVGVLDDHIVKMIALARKEKAKVTSNFNGIEFEVTPRSRIYAVLKFFDQFTELQK